MQWFRNIAVPKTQNEAQYVTHFNIVVLVQFDYIPKCYALCVFFDANSECEVRFFGRL